MIYIFIKIIINNFCGVDIVYMGSLRRKIISIRWNNQEKSIKLFSFTKDFDQNK